ncbi:uncharacterized protein LOC143294325 isoform X2 [Babylonia areolata]|uniref:uncharacterized protein LOC143294325 isoform X2 n=1 Tax=Babylonia areolata TaxID=304850 RepID=UPI003FD6049E
MFSDGAIPRKMVKGETHKHKPGNNSNSNRFRFVPPFTTTSAESSDTGRCSLQRRQRDDDGDRSKQGPAGCGTGGDYGEEFIFRGAEDEGPPPGDSVKGSVGDGPLSAACLPVQSGVHGIAGRVGKEKGGRGGGKNARSGRRRKSTSFRGQRHAPFLKPMNRLRTELAEIRQRQQFLKRILLRDMEQTRRQRPNHLYSPPSHPTHLYLHHYHHHHLYPFSRRR